MPNRALTNGRRAVAVLSGIGLVLAPLTPAAAQNDRVGSVRVGVDLRAELFAIIWRLAGSHVYNMGTLQPYVSDIDRHFGDHEDHPAVERARELLGMGVDFSTVMTVAVHTTDAYELREKVALDAPGGVLEQRGMPPPERTALADAVHRFLDAAREFVVDSRARDFFAAHQVLYDTARARMRRLLREHADLAWFDDFFGTPPAADYIVVTLLATSEVNFGPNLPGIGVRPERYAIISTRNNAVDSAGFPLYPRRLVRTLVHEFNHSYVNDLLIAHAHRFAESGPAVFAAIAEPMRRHGYTEWKVVLSEALVDAAVARYVRAYQGADSARAYVASERREGHVYMEELYELLGVYEADRSLYPTFDAFMPRVAEYYETLPARIEELMR